MNKLAVEIGTRVRISANVYAPHLRPWTGWAGTVQNVTVTPIGFLAIVQIDGLPKALRLLLAEIDPA
jgi:hypothetical protein